MTMAVTNRSTTLSQMRRVLSACLAAWIGASVALLWGAGVTFAQSKGVHVDPDSPAGKEYALPLDAARGNVAGGGDSAAPGGDAPPLFGAGISHRGSVEDGSVSGELARGNRGDRTDSEAPSGTAQPSEDGDGAADAKAVDASADGPSAAMLTALVALGVMCVGVVIGLSLRSLRRTDQPS
jgi:hypothetical protein